MSIDHADTFLYEQGSVYLRGNVKIRYQDMVLTADEAELDPDGIWAQFHDNVVVESPGWITTGSDLRVNLETQEWTLWDGETRLDPEFLEGRVAEPIYIKGDTITSIPEVGTIEVRNAEVTSCDLVDPELHDHERQPHYNLTTERCRIRLGRFIKLKEPTLYGLDHRILRYPGTLRIPFNDSRSRLMVELGQSQVEGVYLKLGYPYNGGRSSDGIVRLHLTSKRGIGTGVEHWFDNGQSAGEVDVFIEPSQSAYSTRVRHRFQYSDSLSTSLNASLQSNSGYGLTTRTTHSTDFTIRNDTQTANSTLGFQRSATSGGGSSSNRFTNNFMHRQRGPADLDWTVRSVYRSNDFGGGEAADEELQLSLDMRRQQAAFDWDMSYKQRIDVDGARFTRDNQYFALDELPALSFSSDTSRMGLLNWGTPITTRLELGTFKQQPEDTTISRASLTTDLYGMRSELGEGHELKTGVSFRQSFYSEGSAQYDARTSANLQSHWGGPWYSRLRYDWERPNGFSPLRVDFARRRHDVQIEVSRYVANKSRIELRSGYDLQRSEWRDLTFRSEYTPNRHNRFELQSSYDIERGRFRPLEGRWQFVRQRHLDLGVSTSYDIEESELRTVVVDSDWIVNPRWRFESLIGYNGSLQQLDFLEARVTRDLHCWLGSLAYSLSQQEVRLNFGLKALPFGDWEYGLGGSGQRLTTRSGQFF